MPTTLLIFLTCFLLGYFIGAFPTGYVVGRMWNIDVRRHGSGRTGGTNVLRTVGWRGFLLTAVGDVGKGLIAILLVRWMFQDLHEAHAITLLGVLIGNNWSVWIALLAKKAPAGSAPPTLVGTIQQFMTKGRGGAGIGVTAGAALGLFPPIVIIVVPIFLIVLLVIRYASVASLTACVSFAVAMLVFAWAGTVPWSYSIAAIAAAAIIILVHKPNIERLRAGTEKRFGERLGR